MTYTIYDSMSGEPLEECSGLCLAEAAEYLLGCDNAQFEFRTPPRGSVSLWRRSIAGDRSWRLLAPYQCFGSESEAQQWVVDLDDSWGGYEARLDGASS